MRRKDLQRVKKCGKESFDLRGGVFDIELLSNSAIYGLYKGKRIPSDLIDFRTCPVSLFRDYHLILYDLLYKTSPRTVKEVRGVHLLIHDMDTVDMF